MGQWSFIKSIIKNANNTDKLPKNHKSINKITKKLLDNESNNRQLAGQVYGERLNDIYHRETGEISDYDLKRVLAEGKYSKERYNDLLDNYSKYQNTLDEDEYINYIRNNFPYILDEANLNVAIDPTYTIEKHKRIKEIMNNL